MAGRHVNDGQARQYMRYRKDDGLAVETAAAKAGLAGRRGTGWRWTLACRRRSRSRAGAGGWTRWAGGSSAWRCPQRRRPRRRTGPRRRRPPSGRRRSMSPKQPFVVDDAEVDRMLKELRMPTMKDMWRPFADRARRRFECHRAEAKLPPGKTLDNFDFDRLPGLSEPPGERIFRRQGHDDRHRRPSCPPRPHPHARRRELSPTSRLRTRRQRRRSRRQEVAARLPGPTPAPTTDHLIGARARSHNASDSQLPVPALVRKPAPRPPLAPCPTPSS